MIDQQEIRATADAIARIQLPDGAIPWEPGRHADPWNHTEAAMGLDVAGLHREARRAYEWLAAIQESDGGWFSAYLGGEVLDPSSDSNFCAYPAAGIWHHYLCTGDEDFLRTMWPTVEAAIDLVLSLQRPDGSIAWARDEKGVPWPGALLTSSACIYLSLRCAISIAEVLEKERSEWRFGARNLQRAVAGDQGAFESRERYAMDWYYPVLSGAISGGEASRRLQGEWHRFVVGGWGVMCVLDRPWITTGETAELIMACELVGMHREAAMLWRWLPRLRDEDGLYWTGRNHPGSELWPHEKTTWSAGSILLAADMTRGGPTKDLFLPHRGGT